MQIEYLPTDALRHYQLNAKRHPRAQVAGIAESVWDEALLTTNLASFVQGIDQGAIKLQVCICAKSL